MCKNFNMIFRLCRNIRWSDVSGRRYNHIRVLGIESSCDDTSAAVVSSSKQILGEGHFSQARFHIEAGGIQPQTAYTLHQEHLKNVVETSLKERQLSIKDLDAIAVTVKPGLIMSLQAGVEYAKDLSTLYGKPLVPIHHMEAHALTGRLVDDVKFPFLGFLISGGHCILTLVKSVDKFYTLGTCLDSSPGQALDKVARRAKLKNVKKFRSLVGGAAIEAAALMGNPTALKFPHNVLHRKGCNFSFSGIWNFAVRHIEKQEKNHNLGPDQVIPDINDLCAGFQWSLTKHLCQKLEGAINYVNFKKLIKEDNKYLVVSGGVASNSFIREALKFTCDHYDYKLVVPPPKLCTDNGVMVAWNGIERLKENLPVFTPKNLNTVMPEARCELGEDISDDVKHELMTISFSYLKLKDFINNFNKNENKVSIKN